VTEPAPTPTAPSTESPPNLSERAEMVRRLNETDAAFSEHLADYTGRAARWSLAAGTLGAAASAYPMIPHARKTRALAEKFTQHVGETIRQHVSAPAEGRAFDTLRPTFERDVREMLQATGRRADGVMHAIERLYERHTEAMASPLAREQAARTVSDEATHLLRNVFTRSPIGGVAAVVGSAVAAGVVGHQLFKMTHQHERQEVQELARECRRLEALAQGGDAAPGTFAQRVEETRSAATPATPSR